MVSAIVCSLLQDAGLSRYAGRFQHLTEAQFVDMKMSDFGKYGITDMVEKQQLFNLIRKVKEHADSDVMSNKLRNIGPAQLDHIDGGAELLDLDDHDEDLLMHAPSPRLQMSPLAEVGSSNDVAHAPSSEDPPKIRVVVRKRPINKKEREKGDEDIVDVGMAQSCVVVNETKVKVDLTKYVERHQFNFDEALDESVSNDAVYACTVQPLVATLFRNGRATCFAYGQTGSGKTYTMSPLPIRAADDILQYLRLPAHRDIALHVSCFEIYGNKVYDLLNARKRLNILEDGKRKVVVVGLREVQVNAVELVKQLIEQSAHFRSVGSTAANSDSSRSHSIMQFALKRAPPPSAGGGGFRSNRGPLAGEPDPAAAKLVGKISFIDLAGSERGADTFDNDRQTRLEGAEINKSLLALKECIRALDSDARHVPFRGAKLTAVLRDSFVGEQARTVMIANISPNATSVEHTLNTLRYADRVKELRKEKQERAPGGVTPGQDPDYYAAVERAVGAPAPPPAAVDRREMTPTNNDGNRRSTYERQYGVLEAYSQQQQQHPVVDITSADDYPDDQLFSVRQQLMDTILNDEEELITAHRLQVEESMDTVRREMLLLTEVDQPGSDIESYTTELERILQTKAEVIARLQAMLESFKQKLKDEESLTKTVGKRRPLR